MNNMNKIINFCNEDWKQKICNWWNNISPVYKNSFLWIFIILNLVFLWHTITFCWGNHLWYEIKNGVHIFWSLFDGRWGAGLIQQVFGGDILPVWNNLFCFAGFTFAVICLAKYWNLPKNTFIYTIFGLFIVLMPYTLPWLEFVHQQTHFWNIFLIVFALILSSNKQYYYQIIAFLLLFFCLSCYVTMISTIFIIFLGRCFIDVWFDNKTLSKLIQDKWRTVFIIVLSFIAYILTWILLKHFNLLLSMSETDAINLNVFFNNLLNLPIDLKNTFFSTSAFISVNFKFLLGLAVPIVICLMKKFSMKSVFLLSALLLCILISTQFTNLISVEDFSNIARIDFFSMPYVFALFWAILLKTGKFFENIAILFMFLIILYSGLQDVRSQKVKYFDNLHDARIYEDIVNRIKINPNFNPDKKYNLLILGEVEKENENTTFDTYNKKITWQDSWAPYIIGWNTKAYLDFYEKKSYIKRNWSDFYLTPLTDEEIKMLDMDYIFNRALPYPNKNSIYIDDNVIYIVFEQKELNKLKERINLINNTN